MLYKVRGSKASVGIWVCVESVELVISASATIRARWDVSSLSADVREASFEEDSVSFNPSPCRFKVATETFVVRRIAGDYVLRGEFPESFGLRVNAETSFKGNSNSK